MLGFFPGNLNLYKEAIRHKSSQFHDKTLNYQNNERLEFLGDAILDAIIADLVFHKYPTKKEGFLTNTRSKIVQRETLDRVASELGLDKIISHNSNVNTSKSHILGNALEALIGAIYLDKGYEKTRDFIEGNIIDKYINVEILAKKETNFKSKLLEWSQKYKVSLDFELLESFTNPENNPVFQSQANLNGLSAGIGIGSSKKESQQNAARAALKKLKTDKEFIKQVFTQSQTEEIITTYLEIINPIMSPRKKRVQRQSRKRKFLHERKKNKNKNQPY